MQSPFQMWRPPYIVQCRMQSANIKTSSKKTSEMKRKKNPIKINQQHAFECLCFQKKI